ncbi:hypothetical protein ABBQ32_004148 [Trebouxia sp. C0010 RCD-2024]
MKGRHGLCVQHTDNLPREKAVFKGPSPLLLSSISCEDLTLLLLGSDPDTLSGGVWCPPSHLGKELGGSDKLPQHLKDSDIWKEQQETCGHASSPAGSPLVQVEVDAQDRGALRLAREATPDVLLCEELKHLSTALTRAKNNVVVFDSSVKQSTPFFNYLHRLGLAQSVSMSALLPPTTTAFTYPEVQRSSCTHKHPRLGYSQHTAYRTADLSVTTTLQQS